MDIAACIIIIRFTLRNVRYYSTTIYNIYKPLYLSGKKVQLRENLIAVRCYGMVLCIHCTAVLCWWIENDPGAAGPSAQCYPRELLLCIVYIMAARFVPLHVHAAAAQ